MGGWVVEECLDEKPAKMSVGQRRIISGAAQFTVELARRSALITEAVRLHMVAGGDDGDSGLDDDEP